MILGPTGVGKTWLASAFGHQACRLGMTVAFYVANDWSRHLQGQRKHTNADPQRHT
ncbi:DNA replication protein DnaC [Hydrogenophaga laconesensis]|uniref:DNA replication protein DnaC n=1 Tax=Hydrogenophaga laconesensis TaxID=1805971 RepID=A0ABU1VJ38_9BURK|nr:DNA replication protein DnaC [Hydrogenophaga laconesensis]